MSWSSRRQFGILAALTAIVAVPVVLVATYLLWERPTCDDGIRNGAEQGVDCGGSCALVCTFEANPIVLSWVRAFEVSPGRYNVVAMIENPNSAARADGLRYRMRILDDVGVAVAEREGVANLDPQSVLPIVEIGLDTGERRARRAEFEWLDEPRWERADSEPRVVAVVDESIVAQGPEPRVEATVQNIGVLPLGRVAVVVVAYDVEGNALAASRTWVERLASGESKEVVFTWPAAWPAEATSLEVMPVYDAPVR
jgi:hypothetical protein